MDKLRHKVTSVNSHPKICNTYLMSFFGQGKGKREIVHADINYNNDAVKVKKNDVIDFNSEINISTEF